MRTKSQTLVYDDVRIDVRSVITPKGKVLDFAINISILDKNKRYDVFRVDTSHAGLHIQEFWETDKPKYLHKKRKNDYKGDFGCWLDNVKRNFEKWVKLFKERHKIERS